MASCRDRLRANSVPLLRRPQTLNRGGEPILGLSIEMRFRTGKLPVCCSPNYYTANLIESRKSFRENNFVITYLTSQVLYLSHVCLGNHVYSQSECRASTEEQCTVRTELRALRLKFLRALFLSASESAECAARTRRVLERDPSRSLLPTPTTPPLDRNGQLRVGSHCPPQQL